MYTRPSCPGLFPFNRRFILTLSPPYTPSDVFLKSLARRLAEDSGVDPESREFAAELRNTGVTYENDTPLDTLFKDWRCMQV